MSSLNMAITASGPLSGPSAAMANWKARPKSTKSAPAAIALTASSPERMPPSTIRASRSPTAARIGASISTGAGDESSCRPPWLETMIPSAPTFTAWAASSGCISPLMTNFRGHLARNRSIIAQSSRSDLPWKASERATLWVEAPGGAYFSMLAKRGAPCIRVASAHSGWVATCQAKGIDGFMSGVKRLTMSRRRLPGTGMSTVTTRTSAPAASVRAIRSSAISRFEPT